MSRNLSVAQMLANLEARITFHEERRAFHAEQEALHHEQLAFHDAELQKVRQHFETFKAAADAAAELATPLAREASQQPEEIPYFGNRPMLSRLAARVAEAWPEGEPFGARAIAEEVNRRYGNVLSKPATSALVSVALRRLAAAGRLRQVRPGKALYEALYTR
jgi:hypothetical protein